jgi:hypothetical protein
MVILCNEWNLKLIIGLEIKHASFRGRKWSYNWSAIRSRELLLIVGISGFTLHHKTENRFAGALCIIRKEKPAPK